MFRAIVLAAALLVGCRSQTTTEPRIIKVFQDIPSKSEVINQGNCNWDVAEVSIFHQKDQKITFDYLRCHNDEKLHLKVKNGNEIFVEVGQKGKHILSVWKTTPHTDKEFVESLVTEKARDKCVAFQDGNNNWKIGLHDMDKSSGNGWVMYPPLSTSKFSDTNGICGRYGFYPGNDWVIGIKGGIGIAYLEIASLVNLYDLNSITYENRD